MNNSEHRTYTTGARGFIYFFFLAPASRSPVLLTTFIYQNPRNDCENEISERGGGGRKRKERKKVYPRRFRRDRISAVVAAPEFLSHYPLNRLCSAPHVWCRRGDRWRFDDGFWRSRRSPRTRAVSGSVSFYYRQCHRRDISAKMLSR